MPASVPACFYGCNRSAPLRYREERRRWATPQCRLDRSHQEGRQRSALLAARCYYGQQPLVGARHPAPLAASRLGQGLATVPAAPGTTTTTASTCATGSSARCTPRWPGWPPRLRPEGGAFGRAAPGVGPTMAAATNWQKSGPAGLLARGSARAGRHSPCAAPRSPGGASPAPPAEGRDQEPESSPMARAPAAAASAHAAVVARRGSWGKPAAAASEGGPERLQCAKREGPC